MRHRVAVCAVAGICMAIAAGCAKSPATMETADPRAGFVACAEPRPEACTMQYDPVCGEMTDGRSKTYSNACVACSDRLVTGYLKGACGTQGSPDVTR